MPAGSCVVDFGEYSSLSSPTYINQHNTCEIHIGITGNCTWYAADRVQQLTGVDLAVYQSAWGDGGYWHITASNHGFPVYQGSAEAINAFGTLAGLVISFNGIKLGFTTHVAVVEKYNDDGTAWVSEMWGSESSSYNIRITSYSPSELASSDMYYIDFSSIGMAPGAGGGYFKDKFGEFHWKETPAKDGLIPLKDEFQSFCDRLNEAQEEAKVEKLDTYSATDNNSTLTAERFNNMLHLMQTSTEGNLKGVSKDEVAHMSDVNKNDLIKAEHFKQLEDLYNHWRYGTITANGQIIPGDDPNCMVASTIWNSLHCGYGLNEYVTAGIIGSAIFETSGSGATLASLDQNWGIVNYLGCYGLWQFCPFGAGIPPDKSVEGQITYLMSHNQLPSQMDTYGYKYYSGFNYNAFLNLQNEKEAAYAFRACYERGDYNSSAGNFATMAYNYFTGKPCPSTGGSGGGIGSGNWIFPLTQYTSCKCRTGDTDNAGDFAAPPRTPICACDDGVVIESGWHWSYGNHVIIDHKNGWKTTYAHMIQTPSVSYGQTVSGGQNIGYVGSTGTSTGPHLHLEMEYNGIGYCPCDIFGV